MKCFDTTKAMSTVKQICANSTLEGKTSPHVNTQYLQRGRKRLDVVLPQFEKLGYEVKLQQFPYKQYTGTNALITTKNDSPGKLLLTGHHDYCAALGAEDNATALAIMLELARSLAGEEINVAFSSFDLEEVGARGSNHFVDSKPQEELERDFDAVIALECLGSGKEVVICEAVDGATSDPALIRDLSDAARTLGHKHVTESFDWFYSDHVPFARQGINVAEVCSADMTEYYLALAENRLFDESKIYSVAHTSRDTPQSINYATINAAGETLLQFIRNYKA